VVIAFNQTAHVSGVYQQQGAVQVTIHPAAAVIAGAHGSWTAEHGRTAERFLRTSPLPRTRFHFCPSAAGLRQRTKRDRLREGTNTVIGVYTGLGYNYATIAGTAGSSGWADGTNAAALFHTPVGIAVNMQTTFTWRTQATQSFEGSRHYNVGCPAPSRLGGSSRRHGRQGTARRGLNILPAWQWTRTATFMWQTR